MLQGIGKPQQDKTQQDKTQQGKTQQGKTQQGKTQHIPSYYWERAWHILSLQSTHTGALLLFLASCLIALPGMQEDAKSFVLVVFACVALLTN
jgi:hypothetical protein